MPVFWRGPPNMSIECRWSVKKKSQFSTIMLHYFQNDTRESLWNVNRKLYPSFWMLAFLMNLNDPNLDFKVTPLFGAGYFRNDIRWRHSLNRILIGTCTCRTSRVSFRMTLSDLGDLAKYSMTRSITQPLCGRRTSCFIFVSVSK